MNWVTNKNESKAGSPYIHITIKTPTHHNTNLFITPTSQNQNLIKPFLRPFGLRVLIAE